MVGKRVNTTKSEAMVLTVKGGLHTLGELLPQVPQVEDYKNLRLLFRIENSLERDMDRWINMVTTVLQQQYQNPIIGHTRTGKVRWHEGCLIRVCI